MAMSNGAARMLGALGLAALAGGLAYGVHMVLPASEPEVTPATSPSDTGAAAAEAFCAVQEEMLAWGEAYGDTPPDGALLNDETAWADPAMLDEIHADAQAMLEYTEGIAGFSRQSAELTTDAEIAVALGDLARAFDLLAALAQAGLGATTLDEYAAAALAVFDANPDASALMDGLASQGELVDQYVLDVCGLDTSIDGVTDPTTAVKKDASLLGREIAIFYVDWETGDPPPVLTAADGAYLLGGVVIGEVSAGVELTDFVPNGHDDWCVELTSAANPDSPWTYSAQSGLAQGTCS